MTPTIALSVAGLVLALTALAVITTGRGRALYPHALAGAVGLSTAAVLTVTTSFPWLAVTALALGATVTGYAVGRTVLHYPPSHWGEPSTREVLESALDAANTAMGAATTPDQYEAARRAYLAVCDRLDALDADEGRLTRPSLMEAGRRREDAPPAPVD